MKLLRKRTAFFLVCVMVLTTLVPNNVVFAQELDETDTITVADNESCKVVLEQSEGGTVRYMDEERITDENICTYQSAETVTLEVIPDDGYILDVVKLKLDDFNEEIGSDTVIFINPDFDVECPEENGEQVTISDLILTDENKFSFEMVDSDVTVKAEFSLQEDSDSDVLDDDSMKNETVSEKEDTDITGNSENILNETFEKSNEEDWIKEAKEDSNWLCEGDRLLTPEEMQLVFNELEINNNYGIMLTSVPSGTGGTVTYYKKLEVPKATSGSFEINNQLAFCIDHEEKTPPKGTSVSSLGESGVTEELRKVLYYGYGGPGTICENNDTYHAYTSLCASTAVGTYTLGDTIRPFYDTLMAQPSPPSSFTVTIWTTGSSAYQRLATWNYNPTGKLNLTKTSANPTLTNGNSCYSLENAVFGVYTDSGCSNQVATLTTDASGNSNTVELDEGTYHIKELVAPKGFALSSEIKPVNVTSGNTATVSFTDVPQSDPVGVLLGKIDKETSKNKPQGSASLAGAEFTVKYYSGFFDVDPATQGQNAVRTWVIRTDENGYAELSDNFKVSGDNFYYNGTSAPTLPLGTITIQETKAPTGYLVNNTVYIQKITSSGSGENVFTYNQPSIPEQSIRGGVKICKRDSETKRSVAQGGATLGNAQFSIVTLNDNPVVVDGVEYRKGQVVKTIVTDSTTNIASTGSDTLPFGNYKIYESQAPTGYKMDGAQERQFSITQNGVIVDLTDESNSIYNDVIRGGVKICKRDSETKRSVAQGGATLGNAYFNIITLNDNPVVVEGHEYSKGQVVKTIVTDSTTNIASTGNNTLPYGTYKIIEAKAPTGYLSEGIIERTFSITQDGVIVDLTSTENSILNDVIRGGVEIYKRDYETNENKPQGSATLEGAVFDIITLNDNSVLVDGTEYSKGEVVKTITTDIKGYASTATDTLPYGTYKIIETKEPTGYLGQGVLERQFRVTQDGVLVDMTGADNSIRNKVIRGDIELSKFGRLSETSEATEMNPLEGVIFSVTSNTTGNTWYLVTNENGYADSECQNVYSRIITNSDGTISVDENSVVPRNSRGFFPYDTYTIKELNTPRGFMPINDITFHLKSNGYKYQWILEDRNVMSAVRIVKTDAETGNTISLAGVTFKIYDENMNPLTLCISHYPKETYADEFSTDETGTFVLPEKLQVGTYYLEELSAPEGYLLGGIMQFDIEEGRDWTQPVEIYYPNENVKGKIELEKTDSLSGEAVEGAVYGIYAKEDVVTNDGTTRYFAGQKVDTVTTDEEGKAISGELYLGKYMVKELESPDRYKLDEEEYDVELTYEDETTPIVYTSLEVVDDPNTIYIIKKDKETGEPLEGATLQLINADGEIVDEWITDKEAHEITKLPLGTYILHEEVVPDGYNVAEDMEIEIKGGIVTTEIEMEDAPIQTTFEKFDALDDENSLVGATYQLINEEGEIVDEWVTDGKPHEIYAPVAGEYTVHEEIAPIGYDIEEDYTITVVESEKTQEFRMTDNPLRARIDKKSSDTDESLIGATLQLINEEGEIVDEWVTDGQPHEVYAIPFGTYTLHEKEAPIGYATAEDMEIEIKQIGEIQTFIMVDDPIVIQISKIEGDEKTDIEGATLQLISEDGDIIDEWVTDGQPHEIRNVPVGTHTLHEKEAPSGYAIAEDMEIEVKDSKEIQYFSMTDKKIGSIVASMKKGAGKPQGGIIEQIGKLFSSPKTGDSVHMMFLLILLSMSAGIAGFSVYRNRKRRKAILATESSNREKKRAIKKKKSGIFFLLIVSLVTVNCDTAFAKNKDTDITKEYEYITSDKEEKSGDFEKEIEKDNRTYKLEGVDYEVVKSVPVMETEEVTKSVESDFVMKSEEYIPEDTITEDGITYTLEDCSVLDGSEYTKTYTAHYDYLETDTTIPTNKEIGVTAENGSNVQINGKLSGTERVEDGEWIDASVSITFDHYDTGIFEWQGKTIYLNSEHPLEGYDTELLESVGADTNSYRVVSTVWSGEPYVVDGVVYRDATANVQYFVNYVRATYTGTIDYVKYQSNYKGTREVESTENFTYLMKANATYTMENSLSVAQIVMFTAIGIAILAVLVVLILSVISKRKDKDNDNDKKKNEAVTIITQGGI